MNGSNATGGRPLPGHEAAWHPRDIDLDAIETAALADHPLLFDLVVGASFVEISAEHYTRNLVDHCTGRDEVVAWLADHWEPEELRHGEVLRDYALRAWPDFPWQAAYEDFFADYAAACSADELEDSRALEMAARCVVETGTATFYRMLADYSPEPVLARIATLIGQDEVRHYRHFRHYFELYNGQEGQGRLAIVKALRQRFGEVEEDDVWYAFKHIHRHRHGREPTAAEYRAMKGRIRPIFRRHFPYRQAARMLLRVLDLDGMAKRAAEGLLVPAMRLALMR
ncbi:MAG: ferritin-like domain-containing protein [Gammaproteobacteria bacterium]|nr:ferritin-like domain-containing protein [Gammaproteobacteria bacterium]